MRPHVQPAPASCDWSCQEKTALRDLPPQQRPPRPRPLHQTHQPSQCLIALREHLFCFDRMFSCRVCGAGIQRRATYPEMHRVDLGSPLHCRSLWPLAHEKPIRGTLVQTRRHNRHVGTSSTGHRRDCSPGLQWNEPPTRALTNAYIVSYVVNVPDVRLGEDEYRSKLERKSNIMCRTHVQRVPVTARPSITRRTKPQEQCVVDTITAPVYSGIHHEHEA